MTLPPLPDHRHAHNKSNNEPGCHIKKTNLNDKFTQNLINWPTLAINCFSIKISSLKLKADKLKECSLILLEDNRESLLFINAKESKI